jgi:hypothetical protein
MPSGGMIYSIDTARALSKADKIEVRDEYAKLADLYVLVAANLDFEFISALFDAMSCAARTNGQTWFPERDTINIVFHGTNVGYRLRELLITLLADFGEPGWLREGHRGHFHDDFLFDCLHLALQDKRLTAWIHRYPRPAILRSTSTTNPTKTEHTETSTRSFVLAGKSSEAYCNPLGKRTDSQCHIRQRAVRLLHCYRADTCAWFSVVLDNPCYLVPLAFE